MHSCPFHIIIDSMHQNDVDICLLTDGARAHMKQTIQDAAAARLSSQTRTKSLATRTGVFIYFVSPSKLCYYGDIQDGLFEWYE